MFHDVELPVPPTLVLCHVRDVICRPLVPPGGEGYVRHLVSLNGPPVLQGGEAEGGGGHSQLGVGCSRGREKGAGG